MDISCQQYEDLCTRKELMRDGRDQCRCALKRFGKGKEFRKAKRQRPKSTWKALMLGLTLYMRVESILRVQENVWTNAQRWMDTIMLMLILNTCTPQHQTQTLIKILLTTHTHRWVHWWRRWSITVNRLTCPRCMVQQNWERNQEKQMDWRKERNYERDKDAAMIDLVLLRGRSRVVTTIAQGRSNR